MAKPNPMDRFLIRAEDIAPGPPAAPAKPEARTPKPRIKLKRGRAR